MKKANKIYNSLQADEAFNASARSICIVNIFEYKSEDRCEFFLYNVSCLKKKTAFSYATK